MGFAIFGTPKFNEVNKDSIDFFLKLKFQSWLYEQNYDVYTRLTYYNSLNINSKEDTKDIFRLDETDILNKKKQENSFIIWELKTLKGLIKIIEDFFKFYKLDEYNRVFFKNEFESKDKLLNNNLVKKFIKKYKNKNNTGVLKKSELIYDLLDLKKQTLLQHLDKLELYVLVLIYLDYIKIEKFLEEKISYNPVENESQKEKEKEELRKEIKQEIKEEEKEKKKLPFYCKIGALFAQGFIKKEKCESTSSDIYYYKNKSFIDFSKLANYLKSDVLKVDQKTSIVQYINNTLREDGIKNFYDKKSMMNNIYAYCKKNNLKMTPDFQQKYDAINKTD